MRATIYVNTKCTCVMITGNNKRVDTVSRFALELVYLGAITTSSTFFADKIERLLHKTDALLCKTRLYFMVKPY